MFKSYYSPMMGIRVTAFFILHIYPMRSACSSSRFCSRQWNPGCEPKAVHPPCALFCTWMKFLVTCLRSAIHLEAAVVAYVENGARIWFRTIACHTKSGGCRLQSPLQRGDVAHW